ncbi:MAG: SCO family protein [Gemmatimonas sp.]|jgi:protein SCO1/2|uniref:SCO family protein n=1 Tax=Gemmatimonas sp. TaxID=1962908 RepID=UPI00391F6224|nr:SCO family protein [Gemmatimonadota bacterium]
MRRALTRSTGALLAAWLFSGCESHAVFDGVAVDPPRPMAAFTFARADGSPFATAPEPGRPMVLFFGYTHCPDVCPTTLADWKRAKAQLGDAAARVRWVFVSVDPERDTPAVAQRYATQYDASFVGLSGDPMTTANIMQAFGVAAAKEDAPTASGYLVSHSSQVFLVDDTGALVALYPFGTRWEALAADLGRVLRRTPLPK